MNRNALALAIVCIVQAAVLGQPRQNYSINQAVSENAQLHTIAFSGLAFVTGDFGAATFLPPGKVCDYFGFQYMRDIDAQGAGHNPKFLNRVSGNVLVTLDGSQNRFWLTWRGSKPPSTRSWRTCAGR